MNETDFGMLGFFSVIQECEYFNQMYETSRDEGKSTEDFYRDAKV